MNQYYSTKDIAIQFQVNVITVRRWIEKGLLSAIKLDKDYRISKEDLNKFIEERKTKK